MYKLDVPPIFFPIVPFLGGEDTHLTPVTCRLSSLAHSSRCLQSFSVEPNGMAVSSLSQQLSDVNSSNTLWK